MTYLKPSVPSVLAEGFLLPKNQVFNCNQPKCRGGEPLLIQEQQRKEGSASKNITNLALTYPVNEYLHSRNATDV